MTIRGGVILPALLLVAIAGGIFAWGYDGTPAVVAVGSTVLESDTLKVTHTHQVNRLHVDYVREGRIYAIEDHFVYLSEDTARSFRLLGRLPKAGPPFAQLKDAIARLPVVRSMRRYHGPWTLIALSTGTVLVFYDYIYRLAPGQSVFTPVFSLSDSIQGPFPHGVTVDAADRVYFGEYDVHADRPARPVLRGSDDGRVWEVVYTFPRGAISHVHSIQYDSIRDRLWIATGDEDHESALLYTDDGFASLDTLGYGSQDWRIVSLIVTDKHLFWGSDDDRDGAGIFRWSFAEKRVTRVQDIGSPSYFSTRLRDGTLIVSTTYEPDSRYTRRYSPEPTADLWASRDGTSWHRILSLPYRERRGGDYAERARILLPAGDQSAGALVFSPFETKRWHFSTQRWQIDWAR